MSTISMPSGITRGRATSCCFLGIRTAAGRGLFGARSVWVGFCASIIERRRDAASAGSVFLTIRVLARLERARRRHKAKRSVRVLVVAKVGVAARWVWVLLPDDLLVRDRYPTVFLLEVGEPTQCATGVLLQTSFRSITVAHFLTVLIVPGIAAAACRVRLLPVFVEVVPRAVMMFCLVLRSRSRG